MVDLAVGLRTELTPGLQTYVALLPLGLHRLDAAFEREAAENPWLELVERPLANYDDDALRAIAAPGPSLADHLSAQLSTSMLDGATGRAVRYIIEALDDHGYLRDDVATIAKLTGAAESTAVGAVEVVQALEPAGVGARSLGERFRIQLAARGEPPSLALRLTFELESLAAEGARAFATARGIELRTLRAAIERLRDCDPDPTRDFGVRIDRMFPEIVFARGEAGLEARVDRRFWPDVRMSTFAGGGAFSDPMRRARKRAQLLIDALGRRRTTLERLAHTLLDRQRAYLESGDVARLVPLSGRALAGEIGCAESTVSRAIAARYALTPFGTIPLRALIVRRPGTVNLPTAAVRERVGEIARSSPGLSDDAIARTLKLRGIRLARRTVAKYRRDLGLASSWSRQRA